MNEDEIPMETDAIALEDSDDTAVSDVDVSGLIGYVQGLYSRAEDYRYQDEERWIKAYRNYRGLYGPDVQFTEAEKSRVFIKVTKTKTLAAYGQIVDVLFAANRFPLSVDPTELPEGVVESVHFDPKEPDNNKIIIINITICYHYYNNNYYRALWGHSHKVGVGPPYRGLASNPFISNLLVSSWMKNPSILA